MEIDITTEKGIEKSPLDKLWSIFDIQSEDETKEKLNETLDKIDCNEIESKLFQTIKIGEKHIRSISINGKHKPHLLIDDLLSTVSDSLENLISCISYKNLTVLLGTR